ncbi:TPA: prophage tail fiber N-terminal domain-containing protein [Serratia rubidaea]|nr:prophage tail fiber N-terminal domain-containing protein [Serratia rubidaea]HDJ1447176.1 prophage tail fiber N-terminal domain-containing protein [Serratia rubidaea]HDJ1463980.1 prophage tail fiber N-terminal domain-containing protein [Serratia rubidaea]
MITISGTFLDPGGIPVPGVKLRLNSKKNTRVTFKCLSVEVETNEGGEYSFVVVPDDYEVYATYRNGINQRLGFLRVEEGAADGSLNDYLIYADPELARPPIYSDIKKMANIAATAADVANSAVDVTKQAAATAITASVAAVDGARSASESERNSLEYSGMAADSAEASVAAAGSSAEARDMARDYASQAQSISEAYFTFKTVADGLAGTTPGQFFRVPGMMAEGVAFYYYLNDDGKAVQVSQTAGAAAVESAIETARRVDSRTAGLNSIFNSDGKVIFGDPRGRQSLLIEKNGDKTLFGKTKAYFVHIADRLLFGNMAQLSAAGSSYKWGLMGSNFRVALGLRKDNRTVELHGIPLTTQRGALPNDAAVTGDSISQFGLAASQPNAKGKIYGPLVNAQCWAAWAMLFTGGRFRYAGTYATGGYTAAEILATHIPRVIAAKPTFCIVLAGRNDVVKRLNFEQVTRPVLTKIYSKLRRAGIIPVVCSMSAQSFNTPDQDVLRYKINAFNRAYAAKYGLPFVDLHAATTDPLTGQWLPGYNQDASHPWPVAAKVMGKAVADAMNEWMAPTTPRKAISVTTPETSDNLLANPLFIDHTDGIPDGWVIDSSGMFSVADDPDVLGNAFVMSGRAGSVAMCHRTLPVTAGRRYGFGIDAKITASLSSWVSCYVVAGSSTEDTDETVYLAGLRNWKESTDGYGYFYYEFAVPDDATEITIIAKAQDGTLSVAQGGVFNITEI